VVIWGLSRDELETFEGEERLRLILFGEEGEEGEWKEECILFD